MKFLTVSELRAHATSIVAEIENTGEEVVITKNGRPVVLLRPVAESEFELKSRDSSLQGGKSDGEGERDLQAG